MGIGEDGGVGVATGPPGAEVGVGSGVGLGDGVDGGTVGVTVGIGVGVGVKPAPDTTTTPFIAVPPGMLWT